MGRLAFGALVCLAACYSPHPQPGVACANGPCPGNLECVIATNTCELPGTGRIDANVHDTGLVDTPINEGDDASACFGTGIVRVCLTTTPTPLAVTGPTVIDTDASPQCVAYTGALAGQLCVVAGSTVSVPTGSKLSAIGSRPLVILATDSMSIDGSVDVASHRGGGGLAPVIGAGANANACTSGTTPIGMQGGPGGSFGGSGGNGGTYNGAVGSGPAAPAATTNVTTLRGGCKGNNGAGTTPGNGGNGGGAVYLIAVTAITINGTVNASGSGGDRAQQLGGAGGGGSGGMIGLDAPTITIGVGGQIFANGGGGGEGATTKKRGISGADPMSALTAAARGTGGAMHGGDGGNGAAGLMVTGENGRGGNACGGAGLGAGAGGGGGGGGGGAGVIRGFSPSPIVGAVSPPPS